MKRQQHGQPHAGNVIHVAEVQEQPRLVRRIYESIELISYAREGFFVQRHLDAGKVNHGHIIGFVAPVRMYEFGFHE